MPASMSEVSIRAGAARLAFAPAQTALRRCRCSLRQRNGRPAHRSNNGLYFAKEGTMRKSMTAILLGAAVLAGCASDGALHSGEVPKMQSLASMMADADRA